MPKISVIVPVYNVEKYLNRCVDSILAQTFDDFEIILIDDGSKDSSSAICDGLAKKKDKIKVLHKENGGQSSARNMGLSVAQGEYISFVDSDDWIEQDMFEYLHGLLQKYPEAQMAQCDWKFAKEYMLLDDKGNAEENIRVFSKKDMLDYFFRIHGEKSNNSICNRLYKKEILSEFEFKNVKHEDVLACLDFFMASSQMVVSDKVLYHYFVSENGVTLTFNSRDLGLINVWDMVCERVRSELPEYVYYAEMGKKRAYFTLLSKMRLRGFDKNDKFLVAKQKELKKQVRKDFKSLIRWRMPISRKILLVLVCI